MPVNLYGPGALCSPGVWTFSVHARWLSALCSLARAVRFIADLLAGLGKRKRVMDEKELMMPLKLGWVKKWRRPLRASRCSLARSLALGGVCLSDNAPLFARQVAKRNADQSGGGAAAGRGGLLRPLWQKTEAVPRCNEGTAAPPSPSPRAAL